MEHIKLSTIKRQLQERMHYPLTREEAGTEYLTLDEAFEELLRGFRLWLERNNKGSQIAVYHSVKRGWMTEKLADMFTDYCIKDWRII